MPMLATIDDALRQQTNYRPNEITAQQLKQKNLVMFVAPAAVGKTFLMNKIATQHDAFRRVPVFTTREARPDDDPGMFRNLPHDDAHIKEVLQKISAGNLVQYVVHPSGKFYGTEIEDYPSEYNMLATLSSVAGSMRQLPFKNTIVVGVVTDIPAWEIWFNDRFPPAHPERQKRLNEVIASLEWLLAQPEASVWAYNKPGDIGKTASTIIDTILYNKRSEDAAPLAREMQQRAKEML